MQSGICVMEKRSSGVEDRRYRVEERIGGLEPETRVLEKWISVLWKSSVAVKEGCNAVERGETELGSPRTEVGEYEDATERVPPGQFRTPRLPHFCGRSRRNEKKTLTPQLMVCYLTRRPYALSQVRFS